MRADARGRERRRCVALAVSALALCLVVAPAAAAAAKTIAGAGSGAGKIHSPLGTAVDRSSGELYVADGGNFRIDKFDPEGRFLAAWGFGVADGRTAALQSCGPAAEPPTVRCFGPNFSGDPGAGNIAPDAVAVDQSSHDLYVADGGKRRVTKFGPEGEFIFMVGKEVNPDGATAAEKDICTAADLAEGDECGAGGDGGGAGEFFGSDSPSDMTVDASGRLWVLDGARIDEFDSAGALLSQVTIPPGPPAAKGLARNGAGDFFTIREGKDEHQEVAFSGFAEGDTFELGNLPASCSAVEHGADRLLAGLEAMRANLEAGLRERCGANFGVVRSGSASSTPSPPRTSLR